MGLVDVINKEDRVEVKISDLYQFMKEAARGELIQELALCEPNKLKAGDILQKLATYRKESEE